MIGAAAIAATHRVTRDQGIQMNGPCTFRDGIVQAKDLLRVRWGCTARRPRHSRFRSTGVHACLLLAAALTRPMPGHLSASDALPPFDWDTVPLSAHVGKMSGDFTSAELDFLAGHYDLITLEKGQAVRQRGHTEAGIAAAAAQIKQRNPSAKVLFYWNGFLDYALYEATRELPDDWHLRDREGELVRVRGQVPAYDLSRSDLRAWWSDTAAAAVRERGADGVFVDALLQVVAPSKRRVLGEEAYDALNTGLVEMLHDTRRKLGPNALVLYNGLRNGTGEQFLPLTRGAMIEHFGHFSGTAKEVMARDLDSMRAAARAGNVVCLKAWPGFSWLDAEVMKKPHDERVRMARERITFPLACFLIAAEPHCYFTYTWGYREDQGTFEWYPEFDKPLGPPKGESDRVGWTYRREFERASVFVDLEGMTATIDWQ